ncbi:unnamed protein product, partial [Prorocentrum cordatum]
MYMYTHAFSAVLRSRAAAALVGGCPGGARAEAARLSELGPGCLPDRGRLKGKPLVKPASSPSQTTGVLVLHRLCPFTVGAGPIPFSLLPSSCRRSLLPPSPFPICLRGGHGAYSGYSRHGSRSSHGSYSHG